MRFDGVGGVADIQKTATAGIVKISEINIAISTARGDKGDSASVWLPSRGVIGSGAVG